jgi:hypothetical protein
MHDELKPQRVPLDLGAVESKPSNAPLEPEVVGEQKSLNPPPDSQSRRGEVLKRPTGARYRGVWASRPLFRRTQEQGKKDWSPD